MKNYRPDIDGLRAVAVLAVVWFHAFPKGLPGGFTGVDVFFVISGYLIASILFREMERGGFSFADFYSRRIRRLFPALLLLGGGGLFFGRYVLAQDEFEQLGKHLAASTLFVQNLVFHRELGYFDSAALTKPLLHLWSLAVEEQFYLFFPPLLLIVRRFSWPVSWLLWALFGGSLSLSIASAFGGAPPGFFLLPHRAWELVAGALLAWREQRHSTAEMPRQIRVWAAGLGFVLILAAIILLRESGDYPGWKALIPVVGSVLVIGSGPSTVLHRWFLSNRPMVWIGLVSYPLYLFHWPLLVIVHLVDGKKIPRVDLQLALILAVGLSVLTYFLFEKRLRHARAKWVLPTLLAGFLLLGACGALAWRGVGLKTTNAAATKRIHLALKDNQSTAGLQKYERIAVTGVWCTGGEGPQTLVVGDSHALHLAPRLRHVLGMGGREDRGAIILHQGGVPPIPGTTLSERRLAALGARQTVLAQIEKILREDPRIDRVVVAARWDLYFGYFGEDYRIEGHTFNSETGRNLVFSTLGKFLKRLGEGRKVFLVLGCPSHELFHPKNAKLQRTFTGTRLTSRRPFPLEKYLSTDGWLRTQLQQTAEESQTTVLDPLPVLSDGEFCLVETEAGPIRYDESHLRPSFMREHGTFVDPALQP